MAERVKCLVKNASADEIYAGAHCTVQAYNFNQTSDANGNFSTHPYVIATISNGAERVISGFTGIFDLVNWIYPTNCTIRYTFADATYYDDVHSPNDPTVLSEVTSSRYCRSVKIDIASINRPYSRISYTDVFFGQVLEFTPDNIIDLTINQSCDLSGLTAPYHVLTGTFYTPVSWISTNIWKGKPIEVLTNIKTIGTYYLKTVEAVGKTACRITAVSALGLLADCPYKGYDAQGGVYTTTILNDITNGLINVDSSWATGDELMSWGVIMEGGDRREALATLGLGHKKYIDGDGQFQNVDLSTNPIALYLQYHKENRVYAHPQVTNLDTVKSLVVTSYDDDTDYADSYRTYNVAGKTKVVVQHDVKTFSQTGNIDVAVQCFCTATTDQLYPSHFQNIANRLWNYYNRRRIWHGKIIWNTNTNEGRCGARVEVPCENGSRVIGNVISSVLRFSANSVTAELQVLEHSYV